MSKKILYLLGLLLTIIIGMYFYWKLCCSGGFVTDQLGDKKEQTLPAEVITKARVATSNPFAIRDTNGDFNFNSNDNFNFNTSGFAVLRPVDTKVETGIRELKSYLNANKFKIVDVTGLYTSTEENTSAFPNLGVARANDVKNYFVSKGISSAQINTFGKLNDALVPDGAVYKGPVTYSIKTGSNDSAKKVTDDMEELRERINDNPLTLYFETAQARINLTEVQRQQIADISRYLDKTPNGIVNVTGHTDNSGSRTTNLRLGQERADFLKGYFVRNGIPDAKINSSSKGPDQPTVSNATEEGRAKNRRTIVSIN